MFEIIFVLSHECVYLWMHALRAGVLSIQNRTDLLSKSSGQVSMAHKAARKFELIGLLIPRVQLGKDVGRGQRACERLVPWVPH